MGRKSRKAHRGKKMTLVKRSEKKAKMGDPKTNGNHGDGPSQTKKQKIESKKMNTEDNAHVFTVEMFPKSIKDKRSKDKERVHLSDMEYKMSKEGRGAEKKLSESVRRGVSLERSEKRKKRRIDNEDGSQLMSSSNDEKGDTFIETSLEKHSRTDIHVHSVNVDSMPWKQDETKRGEINLSGLKFFSTGISTECLAVMQDPSEMHFHGKVSMQVVSGSISVLGHCISAGSKEFSLYSPYCTSAMSVKTTKTFTNDGFSDSKLRKTLEDILVHADSNTLSNVLKKMTSHTVVILFKKLVCPATNYVTSFDFYNELFTRPISEVDYNKEFDVASSIGLHVVTDPGKPLFYLQSELKDITRTLLKSTVTRPVVLVCGGKNVGKSTYCRYLINSFLNKENSIDYLECDVGQTEFTPSSIISLTEVKEPLLGPPFTHLREPTIMSFFGDLSPKDDPERYIHTVRYVYNQCKKSQRPVVVNTMGWNKAMGLSLLLDVIRVIKPTHIIQFDTNVTSKNLPLLNDEYLNDNEGWCIPMTAEDDAAELLVAKVTADYGYSAKFKASNFRDMALLSYLSQLQPDVNQHKRLHHLTPYMVPWNSVGVHTTHYHVPPSQIMYALNASVVALCTADKSQMVHKNDTNVPSFFEFTPISRCVGLGVIRGIDPKRKLFYMLTPVSSVELGHVTTFLKGDMTLPNDVLLQESYDTDVPYVISKFSYSVTGSGAVKIRRNLLRKTSQVKK